MESVQREEALMCEASENEILSTGCGTLQRMVVPAKPESFERGRGVGLAMNETDREDCRTSFPL